jgi:hypothetical protein
MDETTMNNRNQSSTLALLEATLETYGADRTRWPAERRHQLSGLDASNAEARRLISEAQTLDRLLDMAPSMSEERRQALSDRIVTVAKTTPRIVPPSVVRVPSRKFKPPRVREQFATVVALAASLVLGMLAGSQQPAVRAMQELASITGLASDASTNQTDTSDDSDIYSNEDVL